MKSPRGHELALSECYLEGHPPVVCVELCNKWYSICLFYPDKGYVVDFAFPLDACGEAPFLDHAPNPRAIDQAAKEHGWLIDPLSWELMIGRWETEYHDRYQSEQVAV